MGTKLLQSRRRFLAASALTLVTTGCGRLVILRPADANPQKPEDAISDYFKLVSDQRYDDAASLLSTSFQAQLGPNGLNTWLRSIQTAQVTALEDAVAWAENLGAHLPNPPADRREYLVTLNVTPTSTTSKTWSDGMNRRFVDLVYQDKLWQIDAVGIIPGVLVTGQPAASETATSGPKTAVIPVAALHVGPAPVDKIIYQARQNAVAKGVIPWATDPVQVVHHDGPSFGIRPDSLASLVGTDKDPSTLLPRATVSVVQDNQPLLVTLVQPIKSGSGGVWAISAIAIGSKSPA